MAERPPRPERLSPRPSTPGAQPEIATKGNIEKRAKELAESLNKADPSGTQTQEVQKRIAESTEKARKVDEELQKQQKASVEEARKVVAAVRPEGSNRRPPRPMRGAGAIVEPVVRPTPTPDPAPGVARRTDVSPGTEVRRPSATLIPSDRSVLPESIGIREPRLQGYELRTVDGRPVAALRGNPQMFTVEISSSGQVTLSEIVGNCKARFAVLLSFVGTQQFVDGATLPGGEQAYNYGRRGDVLVRYAKAGQETLFVNPTLDDNWQPLYEQVLERKDILATEALRNNGFTQGADGVWVKQGSPWQCKTDGSGRWLVRNGPSGQWQQPGDIVVQPETPDASVISQLQSSARLTSETVRGVMNQAFRESIRREGAVQLLALGCTPYTGNGGGWEYGTGFSVNVNPQFQFVNGRWAVRWFESDPWFDPSTRRAASGSGENEINSILTYLAGLNTRIDQGVPLTFERPPRIQPILIAPLVPTRPTATPTNTPDPAANLPEDQREAYRESILNQIATNETNTNAAVRRYSENQSMQHLLRLINGMQSEIAFLRDNSRLMEGDTASARRNYEVLLRRRISQLETGLKQLEPAVKILAQQADRGIRQARRRATEVRDRSRQERLQAEQQRASGGWFGPVHRGITNSDPYALLIADAGANESRMEIALKRLDEAEQQPEGLQKLRATQMALDFIRTANRSDAAFYEGVFALEQEAITVSRDVSIAVITAIVPTGAGVTFSALRTTAAAANTANAARVPFLIALRNNVLLGAGEGAAISAPGAVGRGYEDVQRGAKTTQQAIRGTTIEIATGAGAGGGVRGVFTVGGRTISALRGRPAVAEPPPTAQPGTGTGPRPTTTGQPNGAAGPSGPTGGTRPGPAPAGQPAGGARRAPSGRQRQEQQPNPNPEGAPPNPRDIRNASNARLQAMDKQLRNVQNDVVNEANMISDAGFRRTAELVRARRFDEAAKTLVQEAESMAVNSRVFTAAQQSLTRARSAVHNANIVQREMARRGLPSAATDPPPPGPTPSPSGGRSQPRQPRPEARPAAPSTPEQIFRKSIQQRLADAEKQAAAARQEARAAQQEVRRLTDAGEGATRSRPPTERFVQAVQRQNKLQATADEASALASSLRNAERNLRTLGLRPGATLEQVQKAYRQLVRQVHPDRNPGDPTAPARFKEVDDAFKALERIMS